ncbi:MAG: 3-phosphoshikimate 1-carboxyvinyltransferase [Victivallaceae bacterium]|nr:3-phosphoshikimate 1-carboxyvinyltransferase [Victivallaceae bacterium]
MKIKINRSTLSGTIAVPGSKSHSIRAIAAATLANGTSIIHSPLRSEDTIAALRAAEMLGAKIKTSDQVWNITGCGGDFSAYNGAVIDMANSGTSLRIFTALAATAGFPVRFDGDSSLRSRPMKQLLDALAGLGVKSESNDGKCPISVTGPLSGNFTEVDGTSSQFLTALLFAAPTALQDIEIAVKNLNEIPYVKITLGWLDMLGIRYEATPDLTRFKVFANQSYAPFEWTIPADFSTAAFPLIAAAATGGNITIANLNFSDLQGDKAVFDYLEQMGTTIERDENYTYVTGGNLKAIELDLNATPDALPAVAVAAACANGTTRIYNVPQARIKETDRIDCMTRELRKMGAEVNEFEDGMTITGGKLNGASLEGYGDHRIVMALTIAAMTADDTSTINGAEAAAITYPNFISDFQKLGADIEIL